MKSFKRQNNIRFNFSKSKRLGKTGRKVKSKKHLNMAKKSQNRSDHKKIVLNQKDTILNSTKYIETNLKLKFSNLKLENITKSKHNPNDDDFIVRDITVKDLLSSNIK